MPKWEYLYLTFDPQQGSNGSTGPRLVVRGIAGEASELLEHGAKPADAMQALLTGLGKDGWELVHLSFVEKGADPQFASARLVFKRPQG